MLTVQVCRQSVFEKPFRPMPGSPRSMPVRSLAQRQRRAVKQAFSKRTHPLKRIQKTQEVFLQTQHNVRLSLQSAHHHLSSDDDKKKKRKTKKGLKKEKGKTSKKIKDKDYQRAQSPNQVVSRYQSLLKIYRQRGTMARAFKRYGVDRNTIVVTAPIAELSTAAPRKCAEVLNNYSNQAKLSVFAAHCAFAIAEDPEVKQLVKDYKTNGKLLPFKIK
ncbi:coiled-coil domain-containing protein 106-like [Nothobranchius furzeri]|uniref:Coiled-coil domain-containing protein 106-like n=1 Tax=Nothobranchius furzeri TaxID=105023 RepID=A0A9D3BGQ2_NOTFU|nr:coiled-coil domain-containing protein 106-like [Nothobranchius furzeri]